MGLERELELRETELARMDRVALRAEWVAVFDKAPAHFLSVMFMRRALLWQAQMRLYGGLKPEVKRALSRIGQGNQATAPLARGARLVREWNGRRYLVDVVEDGFVMDGQRYGSLSEIARRITGTRWSGPRFFGLTTARRRN